MTKPKQQKTRKAAFMEESTFYKLKKLKLEKDVNYTTIIEILLDNYKDNK